MTRNARRNDAEIAPSDRGDRAILHLHLRHNVPNNACVARVTRKRGGSSAIEIGGNYGAWPEDRSGNLLESSGVVSSANPPRKNDIPPRARYQENGGACGFSGASFGLSRRSIRQNPRTTGSDHVRER